MKQPNPLSQDDLLDAKMDGESWMALVFIAVLIGIGLWDWFGTDLIIMAVIIAVPILICWIHDRRSR